MRAAGILVLGSLTACGGGDGLGLDGRELKSSIQPASTTSRYFVSSAGATFDGSTGIDGGGIDPTGQGSTVILTTDAEGFVSVVELNISTGGVVFTETFSGRQPSNITLGFMTDTMRLVRDGSNGASGFAIDALNSSTFGAWLLNEAGNDLEMGTFAGGNETPLANIPVSGSATYTGYTIGMGATGTDLFALRGSITIDADFAALDVTSTISGISTLNMNNISGSLPNLTGSGAMVGNDFTTSLSGGGLNGGLTGAFYGTNADETAGTWRVTGGATTAVGSFAAQ